MKTAQKTCINYEVMPIEKIDYKCEFEKNVNGLKPCLGIVV